MIVTRGASCPTDSLRNRPSPGFGPARKFVLRTRFERDTAPFPPRGIALESFARAQEPSPLQQRFVSSREPSPLADIDEPRRTTHDRRRGLDFQDNGEHTVVSSLTSRQTWSILGARFKKVATAHHTPEVRARPAGAQETLRMMRWNWLNAPTRQESSFAPRKLESSFAPRKLQSYKGTLRPLPPLLPHSRGRFRKLKSL